MIKPGAFILAVLLLFSACKNGGSKEQSVNPAEDSLTRKLNDPELKKANELLMASPNNPDLYYQRGKIYLQLKDYDASVADANRCLGFDSLKDSYYLLLTDAYFFSGKTRKAKEALERCIQKNPRSTSALLKLAEMYFYVKKYQESINYINEALKMDENLAKGYFLKGMCYKESGDTAIALSSFQTACEQDDKYYDAYLETGMLLASKKNLLAIQYFNNALRINPQSTEVIYMVAKLYQDMNKVPQAIDAYNKLLGVDKNNKNALYNLGAMYYVQLKEPKKAIEYFSRAIDADDEYADAYLARGICYEDEKDFENARDDYKKALQYKTNNEEAIYRLNKLAGGSKGK